MQKKIVKMVKLCKVQMNQLVKCNENFQKLYLNLLPINELMKLFRKLHGNNIWAQIDDLSILVICNLLKTL